jgi:hypothetical protein
MVVTFKLLQILHHEYLLVFDISDQNNALNQTSINILFKKIHIGLIVEFLQERGNTVLLLVENGITFTTPVT